MQNHEDYRQTATPQLGPYASPGFHAPAHVLISPSNQPHDMSKVIPTASSAMYAQSSGPMTGAGSHHHQPGPSPATSMVQQQQQMNSRMMNNLQGRAVPNAMPGMQRNAMGSIVSQGPQQPPSHFPQMQMMQSHALHPTPMAATQPMIFQATSVLSGGGGLYQPRPVAPPQFHQQQQFSQVYVAQQCFNYQATPNSAYYPHPTMPYAAPPMNSIQANAPVQRDQGKRKHAIPIIDPNTGLSVITGQSEEKSENSISMTDDQKSRLTGSDITVVQQFAAQVAAVAKPDALPPSTDSIGEPTPLQYQPSNDVPPSADGAGNGVVLSPEVCDQYATEGIVNSHETTSAQFSKTDRIELSNSISDNVQVVEEDELDSQQINLDDSNNLSNHSVMRSTDSKSPNDFSSSLNKEAVCPQDEIMQSPSAEELDDTNCIVSELDNSSKLVGVDEEMEVVAAANSAAMIRAATASISSMSPQSESIDSTDASPLSETQQPYTVVLDGNANDILKIDKMPSEGKKGNKSKKKKEIINKKGESKEGSEMDAFFIGVNTSNTSTQLPAGLTQRDAITVPPQDSLTQDNSAEADLENTRSSTPSPQQTSEEIAASSAYNDIDSSEITDKTASSSAPLAEDRISVEEIRDENENIRSPPTENDGEVIGDIGGDREDKSEGEEKTESVLQSETQKAALKFNYKEGQWSPINPDGKKLYDRDFLLQLQAEPMSMKKPTNLPNLDVIKDKAQLHKLTDPTARAPMPPTPMPSRNFADQFMPNFVRSGPTRLPPHGSINRRSQPGKDSKQKKVISFSSSLNQAVKLHEADNAWKPTMKHVTDEGERENTRTDELYKKVRGILNKLTPQKFDTLVKQVKDLDINNEERLKGVIDLVFEKAIDEPNFSVPYANMCKQLALVKVPLSEGEGCVNFRKLLLTKCQREFEQDKSEELNRVEKKKVIEECTKEDKKKQLQEEYDEEETKYRRRQLGNIRFIGELFKLNMLIEPIMHDCVKKLLSQGDEDSLECLCRLLTTIGAELVGKKGEGNDGYEFKNKETMNQYMAEMQKIVDKRQTSSRVRFMLQDVIDLKKRNWVPRRDENYPKTIDQIHLEAQKELQEQQQLLQNMSFTKRPPDDKRKSSSSGPYSGRGPDHDGGGWNTVSKSNKPNISVDTSRLQLSRPTEVDNMQLGPGSGRGFSNWGRGSSGGSKAAPASESKPPSTAVHMNRYSVLEQSSYPSSYEARRSSQRSAASSRESSRGRNSQGPPLIRKTPSTSKEREKVLEAVNRLTHATQQEPKSVELKVPDIQNVNGKESSSTDATVLKGKELSREDIEKKVRPIIDEFIHNSDFEEANRCITELASPNTMPMIITEAINQVLERSSQARCMFGKLLSDLLTSKVITMDQYNKGFHPVLELVDEYALDIPKIWEYLGEIMEPMTEGSTTNLNFVKDLLQPCIPSLSAGRLVSAMLHCASAKRGTIKVGEMWRESGLQWKDFLPKDSDVSNFITSNKLDFTITPVKSQPPKELTSSEIKKEITFMLNSSVSNEVIFDWIESNIGEENMCKPTFVRALVTCVFEHIISVTGESNNSYNVDGDKVKLRFPLINRYVVGKEDLQLQTLYAAQSVVTKLNQPKGLLKQLFDYLYDDDTITEESYKKWEKSTDPAEQEGKGVALASVNSFFTWLKEAEPESSSEDDPSS